MLKPEAILANYVTRWYANNPCGLQDVHINGWYDHRWQQVVIDLYGYNQSAQLVRWKYAYFQPRETHHTEVPSQIVLHARSEFNKFISQHKHILPDWEC